MHRWRHTQAASPTRGAAPSHCTGGPGIKRKGVQNQSASSHRVFLSSGPSSHRPIKVLGPMKVHRPMKVKRPRQCLKMSSHL
jgi:hypothetical protein